MPSLDRPAPAHGAPSPAAFDLQFRGTDYELHRLCVMQAHLFQQHRNWQRRLVETISFEDSQTLRRSLSLDIDTLALSTVLRSDSNSQSLYASRHFYLPVAEGMLPGPILDIDTADRAANRLNVARRHENNLATTFQLVGLAIKTYEKGPSAKPGTSLYWIHSLARQVYAYLSDRNGSGQFCPPANLPTSVRDYVFSDKFTVDLAFRRQSYTLHVSYVPPLNPDKHLPHDDVLKISWLEGTLPHNLTFCKRIRDILSPLPKAYVLDLPVLSLGSGATHVRLVAPEDTTIGSLAVSYDEEEAPLLKPSDQSFPQEQVDHHNEAILSDDHAAPTIEVVYNRQQAEILTHGDKIPPSSDSPPSTPQAFDHRSASLGGLPDPGNQDPGGSIPSPTGHASRGDKIADGKQAGMWQASIILNPRRGRFLVPALVNVLILTGSVCLIRNSLAPAANTVENTTVITALLTLLPSLLGIYTSLPREHSIVAENQAVGRALTCSSACLTFFYAVLSIGARPAMLLFCLTLITCVVTLGYLLARVLFIEASRTEELRLYRNVTSRESRKQRDARYWPTKHRYTARELRKLSYRGWRKSLMNLLMIGTPSRM